MYTENEFNLATVSADSVSWRLRRNCSVTPAQLVGLLGSLGCVSLFIAGFFWMRGATLVMPFALLEIAALVCAVVVYARHASDCEQICLSRHQLIVEQQVGGTTNRAEFDREWVRVSTVGGVGALIELSGQGRSVFVGKHLRPELRSALVRELRLALAGGARCGVNASA